jgi:4-hydroxybenzoate polyprenyltransferase
MAILGAALGLGTIYDPRIGLWLLFGALYHFVGYGMNSYVDWKKGFDKDDPRKQHHPLNSGSLEPNKARNVIFSLSAALVLFSVAIGGFTIQAVVITSLMMLLGLSYNYLGKFTRLKAVPISGVHTLVFIFPYLTYAPEIELYVVLISIAYFIHHFYQIAISGDIKDIDQDESSLIKSMGATIDRIGNGKADNFHSSDKVLIFAYTLTMLQLFFALINITTHDKYLSVLCLGAVLGGITIWDTDKMLSSGAFKRDKRLKHISRRELAGYTMIHVGSVPALGFQAFGVLVFSMLLYLGIVSKFIWGNWLIPKV